jgi:PAS domain S-box-containing protein
MQDAEIGWPGRPGVDPGPAFERHPAPSLLADPRDLKVIGANAAARAMFPAPPRLARSLDPGRLVVWTDDGRTFDGDVAMFADAEGRTAAIVALRMTAGADAIMSIAAQAARIGGWTLDVDGGRVRWTPELYALHEVEPGYAPTLGAGLDFYVGESRERITRAVQACIEDARPFDEELAFRSARGRMMTVRAIGVAVRHGGRVIRIQGALQDITRLRETETSLSLSEARFRAMADAMPIIVWGADADGQLDFANRFHAEYVNAPFQGDLWIHTIHPDDVTPSTAAWGAAVRTGARYETEMRIRRAADGAYRWHVVSALPQLDADGRIVRWFGSAVDVDDMRTARDQAARLAARLNGVLESIDNGLFALDRDWVVTFANSRACELLMRPAEQLIGANIWATFPQAVGSVFDQHYRRAVETGRKVEFEAWYPPLSAWFEVSAFPGPDGLTVSFRNVNERRAQQERLRLLDLAVSRINDVIVVTEAGPLDAGGPPMVFVNDAFERLTGWTPAEAIGKPPAILQGPGTQRAELDRIRASLTAGQPVRSSLINHARDGRPYWIELDIAPIRDDQGAQTHWVAVQRDITERKASEDRLNRYAARLTAMVDALRHLADIDLSSPQLMQRLAELAQRMTDSDGAGIVGIEGGQATCIACVGEAAPMLGTSLRAGAIVRALAQADAGARIVADAAALDDQDADIADAARLGLRSVMIAPLPGQTTRAMALKVFRADPGAYDALDSESLTIFAEAAGALLRKLGLEAQLRRAQRLEAVGQLTGGVAHDFNNLLTIILGNAEMLAEALEDDRLRVLAEMTQTAAERGSELTGRLLAFARRQPLDPAPTDVNALLAEMDGLLRRTLGGEVQIETVRGGGLWRALVDGAQLESAVLNLCINARDAMPDGGRLTIETGNVFLDQAYADSAEEVAPGQYVMVAISDTGAGMAPEIAARAFEPFFTTKPVGRGSGLGLSMVFGFAKQSRGHVKIYSEPGQGTTVRLYLPRAHQAAATVPQPQPAQRVEGGGETVLVAEDDPMVRSHVAALLRDLGYRVIAVADAAAALDTLRGGAAVDLLFTDVVMPGGINGRELAERARALRPGLPVLFTSGYTENAIVHHGRLDPGVLLLAKPYRRRELAAKIRQALDAARPAHDRNA